MMTYHVPREILRELDARENPRVTSDRLDVDAVRAWLDDVESDPIGAAQKKISDTFNAKGV